MEKRKNTIWGGENSRSLPHNFLVRQTYYVIYTLRLFVYPLFLYIQKVTCPISS